MLQDAALLVDLPHGGSQASPPYQGGAQRSAASYPP